MEDSVVFLVWKVLIADNIYLRNFNFKKLGIFFFNFICEHLLFVQYKKKFADFIIFFSRIFKILHK